jgi:hypothetical protein
VKANQSVVIHLDTDPSGAVRIRTIPPKSELDALREAGLTSLTIAELYSLAAIDGITNLQAKLQALKG